MSYPPISVLMSVYNGEKWLSQAIKSVLCQSFNDFEFVIVNDGSTDGSLKIINQFAVNDSRIRIINKPNTGLTDSLNIGIAAARGEWIARIDADDVCEPDRLECQYRLSLKDERIVLLGSGMQLIDESGLSGKIYTYPSSHFRLLKRLAGGRSFFAHSSALFRRSVAVNIGGYRTRYQRSQDLDLWLRLSMKGSLGCVSKPLVKIRKHSTQISNDDGGRIQLVHSYVAFVSYWMRKYNADDFVEVAESDRFNSFVNWIEWRLECEGVFRFASCLASIRNDILGEEKLIGKMLVALSLLLSNSSFFWVLMSQRLFGSRLPKQLAIEWMRLHHQDYNRTT